MVRILLPLVVGALLLPGCSSVKSQFLSRDPSNTCWEVRKLKGIPITLRVPTHLRVSVIETAFLKADGTVVHTSRDVKHDVVETAKIFTVDPKRPAAGTEKYTADLTDQQYFDSLSSDIQDTTISEVSLALQNVIPLLRRPAPAAGSTKDDTTRAPETLKEIKSVVAVGLFDIESPGFESEVQCFLDAHLCPQNCHLAAESPSMPYGTMDTSAEHYTRSEDTATTK
jgi:hypothetical protein